MNSIIEAQITFREEEEKYQDRQRSFKYRYEDKVMRPLTKLEEDILTELDHRAFVWYDPMVNMNYIPEPWHFQKPYPKDTAEFILRKELSLDVRSIVGLITIHEVNPLPTCTRGSITMTAEIPTLGKVESGIFNEVISYNYGDDYETGAKIVFAERIMNQLIEKLNET